MGRIVLIGSHFPSGEDSDRFCRLIQESKRSRERGFEDLLHRLPLCLQGNSNVACVALLSNASGSTTQKHRMPGLVRGYDQDNNNKNEPGGAKTPSRVQKIYRQPRVADTKDSKKYPGGLSHTAF